MLCLTFNSVERFSEKEINSFEVTICFSFKTEYHFFPKSEPLC